MTGYYKVLQEDIVELPITSNEVTAALHNPKFGNL